MEKDRKRKHLAVATRITTTQPPSPTITSFVPMAVDPNAMEVEATQTREEFLSKIWGKCFGYGSNTYQKR